jgi:methylated-DNA-[protein]-cysteine S-methyltransferase
MAANTPTPISAYLLPTDLGWTALIWQGNQLRQLTIGHPSAAAAAAALNNAADSLVCDSKELPPWVRDLAERLQSYAAGIEEDFSDIPLDLSHLSEFQTRVVRACRKIRRGRVRSYGELATAAGSPGAARAVGSVMAKNRFPIIIPCHRVVGANQSLGGFSAPTGLNLKQRMLTLEGAKLKPSRSVV